MSLSCETCDASRQIRRTWHRRRLRLALIPRAHEKSRADSGASTGINSGLRRKLAERGYCLFHCRELGSAFRTCRSMSTHGIGDFGRDRVERNRGQLGERLLVAHSSHSVTLRCIDNGSLSFCMAKRIRVLTVPSG